MELNNKMENSACQAIIVGKILDLIDETLTKKEQQVFLDICRLRDSMYERAERRENYSAELLTPRVNQLYRRKKVLLLTAYKQLKLEHQQVQYMLDNLKQMTKRKRKCLND